MSSCVKDPILIESDDEDEEVVYVGTTQTTHMEVVDVVDVEAMETYSVIDVEEQPDTPNASSDVAIDCGQFSAPTEGSLEAVSQALDQTLLDISQGNMGPPHSTGGDLLNSSHLGLDSLGSLDTLGAMDPNSFSLNPAGIGLDASAMDGHRTSAVGVVTGGAADLTNTAHSAVAMDLTSGILDPNASSFGAPNKSDFSLKAPLQGSLQSLDDVSSALDLRQQAVDLTVPRSDSAPLTGTSKPLDLNFPDSMSIYPSLYVEDDKSSFLFGSGSSTLTSISHNRYSIYSSMVSALPTASVSVTSAVNVAPSQNLSMATSVTCPQVAASLPHNHTAIAPAAAPAVLSAPPMAPGPVSSMVAPCTQSSPSTAFSHFVQNSVAQSGTQGMACLQSRNAPQLAYLNPRVSQSSMLVTVPASSVGVVCGGLLPVSPLSAPLSSLSGSSNAGSLTGALRSSSGAGFSLSGRDTGGLSSGLPASAGVFYSSSMHGTLQGPSVSSVTSTVSSADTTTFSLPVSVMSAPLGSTTSLQSSSLCGISAPPLTYSSTGFGLQVTGQNATASSHPSIMTSSSSGTSLSSPSLFQTNATSSGSASGTAGGSKSGGSADDSEFFDLFGDLFQLDSDKTSSSASTSTSHQLPVVSSSGSAASGGMAPTRMEIKSNDPRTSAGVAVPSSQSGCGNTTTSHGGSAHGMSNIQAQSSPVMNSSVQTSLSVPVQPITSVFLNPSSNLQSSSVFTRWPNMTKCGTSSKSLVSILPSFSSSNVFSSGVHMPAVTVNLQVSSGSSASISASASSNTAGSGHSVQGNQPSCTSKLQASCLPLRKRKYTDMGLGSSVGVQPAKRQKTRVRMLCAGCYVTTKDWDRVLQCPQGHLACFACLQRQNILFLHSKVEKLCCFDVTCSHIFGNHLVQSMVGTEGIQSDETEEEEKSFVTSNVNKSLEIPIHWAAMKDKASKSLMVDLSQGGEEYKHVASMFHESLKFKIKKICRVQNLTLWRYYNMKKLEMTHEHQDNVDERLLFHGTKDSGVLQNICEKGFDWRYCGKHGTLYGHGSYFAVRAEYSHQYCTNNRNRLRTTALNSGLYYMPPPAHLHIHNFSRLLCGSCLTRGGSGLNPLSLAPPPNPAFVQLGQPVVATAPQSLSLALAGNLATNPGLSGSNSNSSNAGSGSSSGGNSFLQLFPGLRTFSTVGAAMQGPLGNGPSPQLAGGASNSSLPGSVGPLAGPSAQTKGLTLLNQGPMFSGQNSQDCTTNLLARAQKILTRGRSIEQKVRKLMYPNQPSFSNSPGTGSSSAASASSSAPASASTSASASASASASSSAFLSASSQLNAALNAALGAAPPPPFSAITYAEEEGTVLKMMVAKVLVGRYTRGSKDLKKPPPLKEEDPFGFSFDSCVDNVYDPSIHVVFDSKQAYPMWVIEYIEEYE